MTVNTVSEGQTTQIEPELEQRNFLLKANQLVWLLLSIFEALLTLRLVLNLIRAKPATPLAGVIYVFSGFMRLRIFQF